ncbi:MAG: hypothetical protein HYU83_06945 [Chloroflexi bacterium]|nr:hypothetical protein [Chloroflexota bacterium]
MLKWFGRRLKKSKQGQRQAREKGSKTDSVMLGNILQPASAESLRSLLKVAIADAEQIVASIKVRAQAEAEAESARIIAQAKLEVQEIKEKAEIAARKQAEDILSSANKQADISEIETKRKALQNLIKASETLPGTSQVAESFTEITSPVEAETNSDKANRKVKEKFRGLVHLLGKASVDKVVKPVQLQDKASVDKVAKPVQLQDKASVDKVVKPVQLQDKVSAEEVKKSVQPHEEVPVARVQEKTDAKGDVPVLSAVDSQALYSGEVELTIASSAELSLVSRVYNYLQSVPELRILYTRGSWDQGTTITVVLEQPMHLIDVLLKTPGVAVIPELLVQDARAAGKSGPLPRSEGNIKRMKLVLREA